MLRSIKGVLATGARATALVALLGATALAPIPAGADPPPATADPPPATEVDARLLYPLTMPVSGQVESLVGGGCPSRRNHAGIDISSPLGTDAEILAAYPGFATIMASSGGYGLTVDVEHPFPGGAYVTRYAHLSAAFVPPEGRWLDQGEALGLMGGTGNAQIVHLHFELRRSDGSFVDLNPAFVPCRREVVAGAPLEVAADPLLPLFHRIVQLDPLSTFASSPVPVTAPTAERGGRRGRF